MRIITIIGARPQFIKAAALSRAIRSLPGKRIKELIVHTGQHYDANMSAIFFREMQIPVPDFQLNIGSASHGKQTGMMLKELEKILLIERPDAVMVFGDTNSTLAASLAAVKIHIPVFHIEAGLRSYNKSMPEEINRIIADHSSTLLFCPTDKSVGNLKAEGFEVKINENYSINKPGIFMVGDVMYDNVLFFEAINKSSILEDLNINKGYILATIHRPVNTDNSHRINNIFQALINLALANRTKIIIPLHPRTLQVLEKNESGLFRKITKSKDLIHLIDPVSYFEMLKLEKNAILIITDSGGVQKEAWFFKKPLVILRNETEWVEIVDSGNGKLVDADPERITIESTNYLLNPPQYYPELYGDGTASEQILKYILESKWS